MREVVPGTGVGRGRERTGLGGAGRALGHGAVLLRGGTVVRVALAGVHLLLAEVDAQNLPRRLPLAARHRALGGGERREIAPVSARLVLDLLLSWIFDIFRFILFSMKAQRKSPPEPKTRTERDNNIQMESGAHQSGKPPPPPPSTIPTATAWN